MKLKKQNCFKKYSLKDTVELIFKFEDTNKKIYQICLDIKKR